MSTCLGLKYHAVGAFGTVLTHIQVSKTVLPPSHMARCYGQEVIWFCFVK